MIVPDTRPTPEDMKRNLESDLEGIPAILGRSECVGEGGFPAVHKPAFEAAMIAEAALRRAVAAERILLRLADAYEGLDDVYDVAAEAARYFGREA